jgi:hypothetical protein
MIWLLRTKSSRGRSTFLVRESTGLYPRVRTDTAGSGVVSQAGGVLLVDTIRAVGLDRALADALEPWRKPTAVRLAPRTGHRRCGVSDLGVGPCGLLRSPQG